MDPAMVARLAGPEGAALLEALPAYDERRVLELTARLRTAGFDADLVAAALTQSRLRARASDKFGDFASGMFFTPDGLEQATRLSVAARHAARYLTSGAERVLDLACGIGGDALAIAGLDIAVEAVDADPTTAAIAAHNLRSLPHADVRCARAEDVALPRGERARHTAVFVDPSRRVTGPADITGRSKRVFSLDAIAPSWSHVLTVASQVPATGVKLSPSMGHHAVPRGAEAEWTSWHGEVLECVVWFGPLVRTPGRTATVCRPGAQPVMVTEAEAAGGDRLVGNATPPGRYLYEPDRAIVRAGLSGAVVNASGGALLDSSGGYVGSDRLVDVAGARRLAVLERLPLQAKAIRAWARSAQVGTLTIKKRGVDVNPDDLRRQLHLRGSHEATIVLTRSAGTPVALVVQPA